MFLLKRTLLLLIVICAIIPSGTGKDLDDQEFIGKPINQLSNSKEAADNNCDIGACKNCNCCPGYGVKSSSCVKCHCGKTFGCTFSGWFQIKTCECLTGFNEISEHCKANCRENPCKNSGKCIVKNDDIVCNCMKDYTGEYCEKSKDLCSLKQCQNGGKCIVKDENAICNCTETYTGENCQIHKCSAIKCKNSGICMIKDGKAACNCTDRFTGDFCEKDTCSAIKCKNSGICMIKDEKAVCYCTEKYTGDLCEKEKCSLVSCKNSGKCIIKNGKAVCNCTEKYTGDLCEKDKCSLITCKNSGKCIIENGKAVCNCTEKYTGDLCEKASLDDLDGNIFISVFFNKNRSLSAESNFEFQFSKKQLSNRTLTQILLRLNLESVIQQPDDPDTYDPCLNNLCKNGALCQKDGVQAKCTCPSKYFGDLCQYDKCSLVKCLNGGECLIINQKAVCIY